MNLQIHDQRKGGEIDNSNPKSFGIFQVTTINVIVQILVSTLYEPEYSVG